MTKRILCHTLGLLVITVALAFSGCAWNDGYTPVSGPAAGASCGGGGGSGFS